MIRIIIAFLFLTTSLGYGQILWVVDSSSVSFQIKNAGLTVNGTFIGLEAQIDFNPEKLKNSLIVASVDASSVDTGIRIRNNHLRNSDYFHVDTYPRITMKSVNFQKRGEEQFLGDFVLYLKGSEGKVSVPFSFQKESASYIFRGSFEIDRRDYGIGGKSMLIEDNVQITIWVKAKKE